MRRPLPVTYLALGLALLGLSMSGCSYKSTSHAQSSHAHASSGAYHYNNTLSFSASSQQSLQANGVKWLPSSRYGYETGCVQNLNPGCGGHLSALNYGSLRPQFPLTMPYTPPMTQTGSEPNHSGSYLDVIISKPDTTPYTPSDPLPFIDQMTDPTPQSYYPPVSTPQTPWVPPRK